MVKSAFNEIAGIDSRPGPVLKRSFHQERPNLNSIIKRLVKRLFKKYNFDGMKSEECDKVCL